MLSFRLSRVLSRDPSVSAPWPFHAANVALHAACSVLVHELALQLEALGREGVAGRSASAGRQPGVTPAFSGFALLSALLFALHPVHTEAVTGVVGRAELLAAGLSLGALLLQLRALRADAAACPRRAAAAFALSLACAWCALLAKETGFTVLGSAVALEVLALALRPSPAGARPAAARAAAALAVATGYLALRRRVIGGDTLVKIYRKVENPLAFYPTRAQRLLSTAHQHALYAGLLVAPLRLSADWSFACVRPIGGPADPRNALSALLYAAAGWAVAAARPWRLRRDGALAAARLRAFVLLALCAAPFAPAANLALYVGTFIGERLLYMPSVGFSLLLAQPLASAARAASPGQPPHAARPAVCLAAAALLGGYAARTWLRNRDWVSEEALFASALRVCPDSAKVRLNNGILSRRYARWDEAVAHFSHAQAVEPGYCEPDYWIGLTRINQARCAAPAVAASGERRWRRPHSLTPSLTPTPPCARPACGRAASCWSRPWPASGWPWRLARRARAATAVGAAD